jgi:hypothetical protein
MRVGVLVAIGNRTGRISGRKRVPGCCSKNDGGWNRTGLRGRFPREHGVSYTSGKQKSMELFTGKLFERCSNELWKTFRKSLELGALLVSYRRLI